MVSADSENERVVLDFLKTLSTGDLEKVRPLFAEDAYWEPMVKGVPGEGRHEGRDAIIDVFLGPVRGLFKPGDPKVSVNSIASKGDLVIVETTGRGTLSDGRPYDNRYAWALEVKAGKITAVREYMDSAYIQTLFPNG